MKRKLWIAFLVFFLVYLIVGGVVFMILESTNEELWLQELDKLRNEIYDDLIGGCANGTDDQRREAVWIRIAQALNQPYLIRNNTLPDKKWTFNNAFFMAVTIASTIGYGHIFPTTTGSRLFCIFYALLGIPLNNVLFSSIGDFIETKVEKMLKECSKKKSLKANLVGLAKIFLYLIPGAIIFLLIPAFCFTLAEKWSFFDAIYFAFMSLTTIGFGDMIPGDNNYGGWTWIYRIGIDVWIFFGCGFFVMVLNLIYRGIQSKSITKPITMIIAAPRKATRLVAHVNQKMGLHAGKAVQSFVNQMKAQKQKPKKVKLEKIVIKKTSSLPSVCEAIHKGDAVTLTDSLRCLRRSDPQIANVSLQPEVVDEQGNINLEEDVVEIHKLSSEVCFEELDEEEFIALLIINNSESEDTENTEFKVLVDPADVKEETNVQDN